MTRVVQLPDASVGGPPVVALGGALGCKYSALLYSAGIGGAALWARQTHIIGG